MHARTSTHTCTHAHTHTNTHALTLSHKHTHTHTHTHMGQQFRRFGGGEEGTEKDRCERDTLMTLRRLDRGSGAEVGASEVSSFVSDVSARIAVAIFWRSQLGAPACSACLPLVDAEAEGSGSA